MAPNRSKPTQSNQRLKAVVRRLPPDLPSAVFWKTVEPWVQRDLSDDTAAEQETRSVAWSEFKQGVVRKP